MNVNESNILSEVKKIIFSLCNENKLIKKIHIESVVKYCIFLAKELNADKSVCEIAGWLHDIKKLRGEKKDHHIFGSEEAVEILSKLNYPKEKIEMVRKCILNHSSDSKFIPETIEEKIVAASDALSHYDNFLALCYNAYSKDGLGYYEGRDKIKKKYSESWHKILLLDEAKKIATEKYENIRLFLE